MAFQWDRRQIKLGLSGSGMVFGLVLIALKPYLPIAIYHNFADIDDYRIFENRPVRNQSPHVLWEHAQKSMKPPSVETAKLLSDLETTALLAIENGKIAFEQYSAGGGQDQISGSFSMAKSIVSILTGIALQEGRIKSLSEPISNYLPEWEARDEGKIPVRDLLRMTAGLDWNESYMNPFSVTTEAYYGTSLLNTVFKQHRMTEPGSLFQYQSGTTQLLGLVVSRAVNQNLSEYASSRLWSRIGAEKDALWSLDHENGMEKAYCCFNATARDFARIGELVRNRGFWMGAPVVDSAYVSEMTRPHGIKNAEGIPVDYYGYQWWVLKTAEGEIPYARGILGQYILVIPFRNRVIVRLGKATGERTDHHPAEVRALAEWGLQEAVQ